MLNTLETTDGWDVPDLPERAWDRRYESEVRELLVLTYWPVLTRVVGSIKKTLPEHAVEEGDLRSFGLTGLYKAIDRYEPEKAEFSKFASSLIYGAVIDALRKLDWAPRSLRKRQKDMAQTVSRLCMELKRKPTDAEIAEALKWTTTDVETTRSQVDTAWVRSLDELRGESERDMYAILADAQGDPEALVLGVHDSHENDRSTLITHHMADFIGRMEPQKKAVAIFRYYLEMKQSEVARILGIPESRVSALHRSIMEEIHERLCHILAA